MDRLNICDVKCAATALIEVLYANIQRVKSVCSSVPFCSHCKLLIGKCYLQMNDKLLSMDK